MICTNTQRALFALMTLSVVCILGCVAPQTGIPPADPWGTPAPTAIDCPDGICPAPGTGGTGSGATSSGGIEVSRDGRYEVNELALTETKGGEQQSGPANCRCGADCQCPDTGTKQSPFCLPCQTPQASQAKPTATQPATTPVSTAAAEIKTGAFACERCKKPTVGKEWKEIWVDDGGRKTSLMCLCNKCFDAMTRQEREQTLRSFASRSNIDLESRPMLSEAIREVALGH